MEMVVLVVLMMMLSLMLAMTKILSGKEVKDEGSGWREEESDSSVVSIKTFVMRCLTQNFRDPLSHSKLL